MGNCIKKESSMQWGGEDWGSPASETLFSGEKSYDKATNIEEKSGTPASVKEVKIKITKKQLEELLGKMDVQGLSVQQMLSQLLMNGSDRFESHQRSWRPALKSIPEVN